MKFSFFNLSKLQSKKYVINFSSGTMQRMHGLTHWHNITKLKMSKGTTVLRLQNLYKVVGQLAVELEDTAWLFCFAVHPKYRELGYGTDLLNHAEEYCKNHGYEKVFLHVQKEFEKKLLPFYEKRGYKKQSKDGYLNEWIMMKEL